MVSLEVSGGNMATKMRNRELKLWSLVWWLNFLPFAPLTRTCADSNKHTFCRFFSNHRQSSKMKNNQLMFVCVIYETTYQLRLYKGMFEINMTWRYKFHNILSGNLKSASTQPGIFLSYKAVLIWAYKNIFDCLCVYCMRISV